MQWTRYSHDNFSRFLLAIVDARNTTRDKDAIRNTQDTLAKYSFSLSPFHSFATLILRYTAYDIAEMLITRGNDTSKELR